MNQEEIQRAIASAFDSVQLIGFINEMATPLTEEDKETKRRNLEHLWVMLSKEWFVEALTPVQKEILNLLLY